jgi:plasmid stabilization system protein ParE
MPRIVTLTPKAIRGFAAISGYVADEFGEVQSIKYQEGVMAFLALLASSPDIYPVLYPEKDLTVRKAVFRKKTIILYSFSDTNLKVEAISDARSNWGR